MRLKSLDIKGFKSFADKTHIVLDHAITGIVGPNGCGKSNIVDAIRWVIGEHKIKSLRSDNLEDLVFNGSKSRASSGMAEVSLTFENTKNLLPTDFNTVTISRKFYKSGESEYRLNDVICRLKDIHNLFLDTGVSNDSYAIIELGMVDDIIKDKDGSRRRMLEQAAGISMYKTRKKEAKLKLDGTQSDISRIEDLLFEIANNLRTLESQARKAERYYQIKNDYKDVSVELAKASLEDFNDRYQTLQNQYQEEEDKKLKIDTEISGDEAVIEQNKAQLIVLEQGLNIAQKEYNDLQNRIRGLENEKKLAAQRLEHLHDREQSILNFLKNAQSQEISFKENIENAQIQIGDLKEVLEETKEKLATIQEAVADKKELLEAQKLSLEKERQEFNALQRAQFDTEKTVAIADTSLSNIQRRQQQIMDDKVRRQHTIEQYQSELGQKQVTKDKTQQEIQILEAQMEAMQANLLTQQEQLERIREQLIAENRILDAKKNERDLIQSLIQSWEGYPESIQYLSQHKEWKSKAVLISDILLVKNEFKKPLEYILDQYLNYYVVNNIEEAKEAIAILKNNNKGKANFFILDKIAEPNAIDITVPEHFIPALSVVSYDAPYSKLATTLLTNVYIASEDWEAEDFDSGISIVSQDGSKYQKGNVISGGSVGIFEGNKIGRAKNLEKLDEDIKVHNTKTAQYQGEINSLHGIIAGLDKELNDKTIHHKRNELNTVTNAIINLEHKIENLLQLNEQEDAKLEEIEDQLRQVEDSMGDTRDNLLKINDNVKAKQEVLHQKQLNYSAIEQEYQVILAQHNAYTLDVTKAQSNLDTQYQQISFREHQLTELVAQIATNTHQLQETQQLISETNGKLNFGDNELYEMLEKKEKDEKDLSIKETEYYNFRNQIVEHEKTISKQRKEKELAEQQLQTIREELNQMKLKVAGMKERLAVEFKVDLDEVLEQERTNDMSIEELNAEAERLKKRLDNIGEINPTAIEAYQEMKVRHDFIVDQKSDLEQARDTLLATIEEVELTANAKFKETFDRVRENFIQVFKALFTEDDNADLRLTDETNMADTGIEIYAQPKGKRPSTLTQLSGGEKTLTSTAFLFAIYLIKPAPFCILDEVDAPLDDANVGKFTNMIRKFSDNSQFIIVTHNKQTMAAVDVIYGVTMQEAGVSKLVPVDFRSLN